MVISFLYYDDRLCRLACYGVLRRKERQNGSGNGNQCFLAYTAGVLLLYFCGRLLFVPLKFILKLLICSLAGGVFLVLIRIFGDTMGLFLPINPVNSLIAGVCGVPGVAALLLYFQLV